MKALLFSLLLLPVLAAAAPIEIRISVKYILTPSGTRPLPGNIGTQAGCEAEVAYGNQILAAAGRGYTMKILEYLDVQPPPPSGQPSTFWYNLDARANVGTIDAAAIADKVTWKWRGDAVNVYINNSGSGQCCGSGIGKTFSLGKDIVQGTFLHELGHLLGLPHTHPGGGDQNCDGLTPPLSQYVGDGDGISDTAPDRSCFNDINQLSRALYNERLFSALNPSEQAWVNSTWLNVMSYHQEQLFTSGQMDRWTDVANGEGQFAISGKTVFVDRLNNCTAGLPPNYANYGWYLENNPLPPSPWGQSKGLDVTIDPPFPPRPPFWPAGWTWPPLDGTSRPDFYPDNWPWPPTDLPAITFCIGGPRRTLLEGMDQAAPGDTVTIRPGTYQAGSRLTERLTLRATRGSVRLHK
jgi:hypothetical protein